jgi:hypothetical protein
MGGADEVPAAESGGGCARWLHPMVLAACFSTMIVYRPASQPPWSDLEGDVPGAPFFGHTFELLRDEGGARDTWLAARCHEHSAVSRIFLMGEDVVLLCGAKAARIFASNELVDHSAAATAHPRAQLWLASPHRVAATQQAQQAGVYSSAAASRFALAAATALPQQDTRAALLAVAQAARGAPTEVGRELQPHIFRALWRTLFASDGIAIQETYLDVVRDTMHCLPFDVDFDVYPAAYPEAWRWRSCFSQAAASKTQHLIPVLLDEIQLNRQSLGPVLGGGGDATGLDLEDNTAMDTAAEAAHEFILRTLHSSSMALNHAFQALAASGGREREPEAGPARSNSASAWSYGVARADLNVSSYHANADCHAECPSCSTPCEPYTTEHTLPAGTPLVMSWNSVAMDLGDLDGNVDGDIDNGDKGHAGENDRGNGNGNGNGYHPFPIGSDGSQGHTEAADQITQHILRVAAQAIAQGQLQVAQSHAEHPADDGAPVLVVAMDDQ